MAREVEGKMPEHAIRTLGIDDFVKELQTIPDFAPDKVWKYLQENRVDPDTLQPYTFFSPAKYTRNLIFKNDLFEVLAFCWEIGQATPVHNHHNQRGWVTVSQGKLKAQNYRLLEHDPQTRTCWLEPTESGVVTLGGTAAVDKDENVHQVMNLKEWNERAVSVHIYSKPYNTCEIYNLESGTYMDIELAYTSEYGKLNVSETAVSR
jgi:cysteine dioxygenase